MRVFATLGACSALAAASLLSADFVGVTSLGWYGMNTDGSSGSVGSTEFCVLDVYAQFDSAESDGFSYLDQTMLSIFDANVEMSDSRAFQHHDVTATGSWLPSNSLDIPSIDSLPYIDSFVAIGGDPGSLNNTTNDPSLDPNAGATLSAGGGWFTGSPAALQGRVDAALQVFLGRFVVAYDASAIGQSLNWSAQGSYNYGLGTGTFFTGESTGSWTIVPAPGALALLGLAGVVSRRRRS